MDDGELDSTHEMFLDTNVGDIPSGGSMSSFFDEIFDDTHACTHTHTCNPPGPDSSHTHTCYHVHTKIVPATSHDDKTPTDDTAGSSLEKKSKKRLSGNREAVRKYREKKKARAASLEDEVVRLRTLNQQLMKRIQSQAGLEAEVGRLKCLLFDIRGRIDGEIGSFPYQKQHQASQNLVNPNSTGGFLLSPCSMQCGVDLDGCDFQDLQCLGNQHSMLDQLPGRRADDGFVVVDPSSGTKRKGTRATSTR